MENFRSATFGSKDIVIRKSEFVAKTQFLWLIQTKTPLFMVVFPVIRQYCIDS